MNEDAEEQQPVLMIDGHEVRVADDIELVFPSSPVATTSVPPDVSTINQEQEEPQDPQALPAELTSHTWRHGNFEDLLNTPVLQSELIRRRQPRFDLHTVPRNHASIVQPEYVGRIAGAPEGPRERAAIEVTTAMSRLDELRDAIRRMREQFTERWYPPSEHELGELRRLEAEYARARDSDAGRRASPTIGERIHRDVEQATRRDVELAEQRQQFPLHIIGELPPMRVAEDATVAPTNEPTFLRARPAPVLTVNRSGTGGSEIPNTASASSGPAPYVTWSSSGVVNTHYYPQPENPWASRVVELGKKYREGGMITSYMVGEMDKEMIAAAIPNAVRLILETLSQTDTPIRNDLRQNIVDTIEKLIVLNGRLAAENEEYCGIVRDMIRLASPANDDATVGASIRNLVYEVDDLESGKPTFLKLRDKVVLF